MVAVEESNHALLRQNGDAPVHAFKPSRSPKLQHLPKRPPINLEFNNLSFRIKKTSEGTPKTLLHNISGKMQSGELTAIMGPSGAGKSTLMNCLSGFKKTGLSGSILVNGLERNMKIFRQYTSYIMQENYLHGNLTIQESLTVATNLKLDMTMSREQKDAIIEDILSTLSLTQHRSTYARYLSGGEQKRLSIGLELVNNPPVMFFDEPTSGLDSSTCYQCVCMLKMLANGGRTIIITVHQPSALLCEMFDQLYTLADGKCIYQGGIKELVPYLATLNLHCPSYSNPTDYLIDLANGKYTNALVESVDNGKINVRKDDNIEKAKNLAAQQELAVSINGLDGTLGDVDNLPDTYATSEWNQFCVVFGRTMRFTFRDWSLMYVRFGSFLLTSVFMVFLFYDTGNDANKVLSNICLIAFCMLFLTFASIVITIMAIPMDFKVMSKETFNNWYSVRAYFCATTLADIPFLILFTTCYIANIYYFTGQPPELSRFVKVWLACVLLAHIAQTIGIILGTTFSVSIAATLGPIVNVPSMVFSGFFIAYKAMPPYICLMTYGSYVHYAFEGTMRAIYAYGRPNLECNRTYCYLKKPHDILEKYDMLEDNYVFDVILLFGILLGLKVLAYYMLKFKLWRKR